MVGEWNSWRLRAGLRGVECSSTLESMASSRHVYLTENGFASRDPHREKAGLTGFSGETLAERGRAFGVLDGSHWLHEGIVVGQAAERMAQTFVHSVYHRGLVLAPNLRLMGARQTSQTAVALLKEASQPFANEVFFYPLADDTEIPVAFDSDKEWPDPMAKAGLVGYPVSVYFPRRFRAGDEVLRVHGASIVGGDRVLVPATILHHGMDSKIGLGEMHMLPLQPLKPDSHYEVKVDASYGDRRWNMSWAFRTTDQAGY